MLMNMIINDYHALNWVAREPCRDRLHVHRRRPDAHVAGDLKGDLAAVASRRAELNTFSSKHAEVFDNEPLQLFRRNIFVHDELLFYITRFPLHEAANGNAYSHPTMPIIISCPRTAARYSRCLQSHSPRRAHLHLTIFAPPNHHFCWTTLRSL